MTFDMLDWPGQEQRMEQSLLPKHSGQLGKYEENGSFIQVEKQHRRHLSSSNIALDGTGNHRILEAKAMTFEISNTFLPEDT